MANQGSMKVADLIYFALEIHFVAANNCFKSTASGVLAKQSTVTKRGLPYNDPTTWIQSFKGSQISWAYNWDSATDSAFPADFEFVPMLWGDSADHTAQVSGTGSYAHYRDVTYFCSGLKTSRLPFLVEVSIFLLLMNQTYVALRGRACHPNMPPKRILNIYSRLRDQYI